VIVVGGGVTGSATAWWLARWGVDVALVEQFDSGHERASSHGSTRIFRLAYPDPLYVDMARQALALWRELEDDVDAELVSSTGGIDYGDWASVQSIVDALTAAAVPHEIVGPQEATERWPGFVFEGPVLHQPDAGRIAAADVVRALQTRAASKGARLAFGETVRGLVPQGDGGILVTGDGGSYRARAVVVTAGAWVGDLLCGLVDLPPLRVTREQVFHFPSRIEGAEWPSYICHGPAPVYGLRAPGREGVKVAEHHTGPVTTAATRSFDIDPAARARVVDHVVERMPGLEPVPTSETTCLYTNTPDSSFVIERHGPIVVGSACSGHGFKFAPLVGRRLAELAMRR
jgi:monomeric sarcosine oxidase